MEIEFIEEGMIVAIEDIKDRRSELQIPAWAPDSDMALGPGDDGEVIKVDRQKNLVLVKWFKGGVFPPGSLQDTWWVRPSILVRKENGEDIIVRKLGFDFNRYIYEELKKIPQNSRDTVRRKIQEIVTRELGILVHENTNISGRMKF